MAKFSGVVGYGVSAESENSVDVYTEAIEERLYYGDVFKDSRQLEKGQGVNDNIRVSNRISIVADAFAFEHFFAIRYVEWLGTKWKVSDVEVQRPRLILSLGGVYNGPTT